MSMIKPHYLFSVDLEDIRFRMTSGERYQSRAALMTRRYLNFLSKLEAKATFFTVGDIARAEPDLIQEIVDAGHEIAAHSDVHKTLTDQSPEEFSEDLSRNLDSLYRAGAKEVVGYRAPVFSLVPKTRWAYKILARHGITYSSSVLPSKNPLHGWPDFGEAPREIDGVFEIPVSLFPTNLATVPFAGGVYFRVLPSLLISYAFKKYRKSSRDVIGYFHPYDIDDEQEDFMHPGINDSVFYNFLLRFNRRSVLPRLENIFKEGWQVTTYQRYVDECCS